MPTFAFVRHWPDWVSQSGVAGHPVGEKAPVGNMDCTIGYGLYPLARSKHPLQHAPLGPQGPVQDQFWIPGTLGSRILDLESSILDLGSWILDPGSWVLDLGSWIQDLGSRVLDLESWDFGLGSWVSGLGSWVLDLGCWILDSLSGFIFGCLLRGRVSVTWSDVCYVGG